MTSGNRSATLVRTVVVSDEQPPALTLIGDAMVFVEAGTLYKDPGVRAVDDADGVLQAQVVGVVDTAKVGSYALTYSAKDSSGNQSSALIRNVIVRDTQAPVVLSGLSEIRMTAGNVFEDPGGLALDEVDGALAIQLEGTVDTATPGTYILTYSARDFSGNVSLPVVRLVIVEAPRDTQAPVIELLGEASLLLAVGEAFEEPGALVSDNVDGV